MVTVKVTKVSGSQTRPKGYNLKTHSLAGGLTRGGKNTNVTFTCKMSRNTFAFIKLSSRGRSFSCNDVWLKSLKGVTKETKQPATLKLKQNDEGIQICPSWCCSSRTVVSLGVGSVVQRICENSKQCFESTPLVLHHCPQRQKTAQ